MLSACKNQQNIFLQEWDTPYGTAPFSQITLDQYMPAFKAGIQEEKANIQAILSNPDAPTFENTIVAMEQATTRIIVRKGVITVTLFVIAPNIVMESLIHGIFG